MVHIIYNIGFITVQVYIIYNIVTYTELLLDIMSQSVSIMIFLTLYHSLFKIDPLPNTSYRETFPPPPKFTARVVDGDMTLLSPFTLQIIIGIP